MGDRSAILSYNASNQTNNMSDLEFYYHYIYDYEEASDFTPAELRVMIPVAVFYGLMLLLGTIGNVLVIYCVAKFKRMKSITNQLLLSLASADLLLTLFCVPIKVRILNSFFSFHLCMNFCIPMV